MGTPKDGTHSFHFDVTFDSVSGVPPDPAFTKLAVVWRRGLHVWASEPAVVDTKARCAAWFPPARVARTYTLTPRVYRGAPGFSSKPTRFDAESVPSDGGKGQVLGSCTLDLASILSIDETTRRIKLPLKGSASGSHTVLDIKVVCRWAHEGGAAAPSTADNVSKPRPWAILSQSALGHSTLSQLALSQSQLGYSQLGQSQLGRSSLSQSATSPAASSPGLRSPGFSVSVAHSLLANGSKGPRPGRPVSPYTPSPLSASARCYTAANAAASAASAPPYTAGASPPSRGFLNVPRVAVDGKPKTPVDVATAACASFKSPPAKRAAGMSPSPTSPRTEGRDSGTVLRASRACATEGSLEAAPHLLSPTALKAHYVRAISESKSAFLARLSPHVIFSHESESELRSALNDATRIIPNNQLEWKARRLQMLAIGSRALHHGMVTHPAFASVFTELTNALANATRDLRSQLVVEACATLCAIAYALCGTRERAIEAAELEQGPGLGKSPGDKESPGRYTKSPGWRERSPGEKESPGSDREGEAAATLRANSRMFINQLESLLIIALPPLLKQASSSQARAVRQVALLCATALLRASCAVSPTLSTVTQTVTPRVLSNSAAASPPLGARAPVQPKFKIWALLLGSLPPASSQLRALARAHALHCLQVLLQCAPVFQVVANSQELCLVLRSMSSDASAEVRNAARACARVLEIRELEVAVAAKSLPERRRLARTHGLDLGENKNELEFGAHNGVLSATRSNGDAGFKTVSTFSTPGAESLANMGEQRDSVSWDVLIDDLTGDAVASLISPITTETNTRATLASGSTGHSAITRTGGGLDDSTALLIARSELELVLVQLRLAENKIDARRCELAELDAEARPAEARTFHYQALKQK
mmetsp:Transcript_23444/g.59423  ORF Transcript_23444/g.59423 Transcript_23444/m.59423 type:complete len:888 (+) Transcript_23444:164-2827(+)